MPDQGEYGAKLAHKLLLNQEDIIRKYEEALDRSGAILLDDEGIRQQCLAVARTTISHVADVLRDDPERNGSVSASPDWIDVDVGLARQIGAARAAEGIHPTESLRAISLLFGAVLDGVRGVTDGGELGARCLATAAESLHHNLMHRIQLSAGAYTGFLLDRTVDAQIQERRRIARELHDRLGSGLSAAGRALEVAQINLTDDPARAEPKVEQARRLVFEAVEAVRQIARDLHLHAEPGGLSEALARAVAALDASHIATSIEVQGDQSWVPPATLDELFLVLREAVRNAYEHASPRNVAVTVQIAPHELRASVVDDGTGFEQQADCPGLGITSMRERVALLGGRVDLRSDARYGTAVEVRVPMSGRQQ